MKSEKQHLFIVAGANGSGKSTFCSEFLQVKQIPFLNADEIAKEICPENMESVAIAAGKELYKRLDKVFENKESFAIESTLAGKNYIRVIQKAKELNYEITLIYVFLENENVCINRVRTRVLKGGHNVPEEDIKRRYFRSKYNFWNLYKDLVDNWEIYYNSGAGFVQVAKSFNKEFEIINEIFYKNFIEEL